MDTNKWRTCKKIRDQLGEYGALIEVGLSAAAWPGADLCGQFRPHAKTCIKRAPQHAPLGGVPHKQPSAVRSTAGALTQSDFLCCTIHPDGAHARRQLEHHEQSHEGKRRSVPLGAQGLWWRSHSRRQGTSIAITQRSDNARAPERVFRWCPPSSPGGLHHRARRPPSSPGGLRRRPAVPPRCLGGSGLHPDTRGTHTEAREP